jgi:ABC-2 type transport system permease protein
MKAFGTLFKTEMKLSLRAMDMVIFAICMPVVVMVILGIIYGSKPAYDGASYTFIQQSFGAVAAIAVCAGGVMGLPLVVSDYRHKKILKRFKVTPVSPSVLLAVQVAVYAVYALVSLILVYAAAAILFGYQLSGSWIHFLGAFLLVMLTMFSIGMLVGGVSSNVKTASVPLQKVADVLPLTQGIKLLKTASLGLPGDSAFIPILVMFLLAAVCIGVAIRFFRWE